jgi:protein-S-isoprenylcysteine O-methyltransferase Ste14
MGSETAFRMAFWALVGAMFAVRLFLAARVRRAGERLGADQAAIAREGRGMYLLRWVMFILLITLLVLYAVNPPWMGWIFLPIWAWLRWLGFAIGATGLALLAWSELELGRFWSAQLQLRKGHRLVTSGPYAVIRHPLYTGLFGYAVGIGLLSAHWGFILLSIVIIFGFVNRIPREEKMLIEQFGDEYIHYRHQTGMFLPKFK